MATEGFHAFSAQRLCVVGEGAEGTGSLAPLRGTSRYRVRLECKVQGEPGGQVGLVTSATRPAGCMRPILWEGSGRGPGCPRGDPWARWGRSFWNLWEGSAGSRAPRLPLTVLLCYQASDHQRPVSLTLSPTLPPQPPAASFPLCPLPSPAGAKGPVPFH